MNKPHKHAELIKAWADGATIQVKYTDDPQYWVDKDNPTWHPNDQYRIKRDEPRLRNMYVYNCPSMGKSWVDEKDPESAQMGSAWVYMGRIEIFK